MANRTKRTASKDARLVGMLRAGHTFTEACRRAGYTYQNLKRWRHEDTDFGRAVEEAYQEGTDVQAGALERRGWQGWDEPVFYKGRKVGHKRMYSDTASIFSLKGRDPKRFNERLQIEHGGAGGGPIQIIQKVYHIGADGAVAWTGQPVVIEGLAVPAADLAEGLPASGPAGPEPASEPGADGEPVHIVRKEYPGGVTRRPLDREDRLPVTLTIKRKEY